MREMKDSGIEWVGQIPFSWDVKPIRAKFREVTEKNKLGIEKNALKFTYGNIVKKDNFDADDDDYVANTILNYMVVNPGTIMLNGLNLNFDFVTQRVALVKERGIITSAYIAFAPILDDDISTQFFTYLLKAYDSCKAFHNMGGGVRKILNFAELKKQYIVYPTITEQKRIANFLDAKCAEIDALTADIQTQIDILEQYKRSVITEVVTKGLNPDVEMKDSGEYIGGIPQNWEISRVKHVAKLITDGAHITPDTSSSEEKFLSVTDMDDYGNLDFDHCLLITGEQFKTFVKTGCSPQKNDVLISKDGTIGKTTVVRTDEKFVIASSLVIIRPDMKKINPYYLKYCLMSEFVQEQLRSLLAGSALKRVSVGKNANLKFVYTDNMVEQQEIVSILDKKCIEINSCIEDKKKQLDVLAEYKKSIIYEYVTEKKEVPVI